MLRKLSIRIVLINMALVGMVLLIVFSLLCYTNYHRGLEQIDEDLSFAAERASGINVTGDLTDATEAARGETQPSGSITPMDPSAGESGQTTPGAPAQGTNNEGLKPWNTPANQNRNFDSMDMTPTIVVRVAKDGSIITIYNERQFNISDEDLKSAVATAIEQGDDSIGRYSAGDIFYKQVTTKNGTFVALTSSTKVYKDFQQMVVLSIFGWFIFMAFFLVISIIMTRFTLKPVKRSWDQQQQFVADASHELKTPLTVILANNSILSEDESLSEDSRFWVDSTQEEAQHMQTLVNHLLYLARSDSGNQKMILQDLSLTDMVFEDILQFEPVAFERGIMIDSDLDDDIHLEGDATMVKQLIHILLDNACKYSCDNGTVKVALKRTGRGASLSVNNKGTPIPPEDLPHIFERFYRSDKARTLTEESGGYGLGLAIAQSIAKDHNAQISCKSSEQDGTTFFVQFKEILR